MKDCISFDNLATIVFVLVDDWICTLSQSKSARGRKPVMSDSEIITLILVMDFLPFSGETQFLGFVRANFSGLFPRLPDQSQFNRRARALADRIEQLRQHWARQLGIHRQDKFLLDTKPVPVVGYKRSKRRSDFQSTAAYGHCASKKMNYFGYKLVMLTTMDGIPVVYDLVPANTDERVAADEVLEHVYNSQIFGDKGFIGDFWQNEHHQRNGNLILTPKRENQHEQNPDGFDKWLNSVRERIEGTFNELQNTGRNLEKLSRKTVQGLKTHVIAKVTSHALKLLLRRKFDLDVLTFTVIG